jgi:hypothetical protein
VVLSFAMKRMGQLLTAVYSRHPFLFWLIGSILLLVITASTLTLRYNSNDDVLMAEIAAGIVTGEPSPFLIFQHLILGGVLTALYSITGTVPWYALQLYAIHVLSAAGLFLAISGRTLSIHGVLLSLVAFVVFVLPFVLHLQFTTVSTSAAINGIVLLKEHRPDLNARLKMLNIYRPKVLREALYQVEPYE